MKKLQNNFTTTEQSKRLLELGVPAYSADCYWQFRSDTLAENWGYRCYIGTIPGIKYNLFSFRNGYTIPCWSVGRLMEIHLKCCTTLNQNDAHIVISRFGIETEGLLQNMYDMVGECALLGRYDFSKLEG